jgi:hypothetical protein
MPDPVNDQTIQFEPSAKCKELWAGIHQGPMQALLGLHGREAMPTADALLVVIALGTELYGGWMLSEYTGYPLWACWFAPIILCVILAIVGNLYAADEHILRCRIEVESDGNKKAAFTSQLGPKVLWRRIWAVPILVVAIVNALAFLYARWVLDIRMFLTVGAFLLGAAIHSVTTGKVWSAFRCKLRRYLEHSKYAADLGGRGQGYQFHGSRTDELRNFTDGKYEPTEKLKRAGIHAEVWMGRQPFLARAGRHFLTKDVLVTSGMLTDDHACTLVNNSPDAIRVDVAKLLRLHQLDCITENAKVGGTIVLPPQLPPPDQLPPSPSPPRHLPAAPGVKL